MSSQTYIQKLEQKIEELQIEKDRLQNELEWHQKSKQ